MRKFLYGIMNGGSSLSNGVIALAIISLIVLGCTCNQDDGFTFGGKNDNTSATPVKDKDSDDPFDDKKTEVM